LPKRPALPKKPLAGRSGQSLLSRGGARRCVQIRIESGEAPTVYVTVVPEAIQERCPMRVLVTGGAGFIGSFVLEALVVRGHSVRVLDSLDPQVHGQSPAPLLPPGVEFRHADVRDRAACAAALDGVDAVVHCAAAV